MASHVFWALGTWASRGAQGHQWPPGSPRRNRNAHGSIRVTQTWKRSEGHTTPRQADAQRGSHRGPGQAEEASRPVEMRDPRILDTYRTSSDLPPPKGTPWTTKGGGGATLRKHSQLLLGRPRKAPCRDTTRPVPKLRLLVSPPRAGGRGGGRREGRRSRSSRGWCALVQLRAWRNGPHFCPHVPIQSLGRLPRQVHLAPGIPRGAPVVEDPLRRRACHGRRGAGDPGHVNAKSPTVSPRLRGGGRHITHPPGLPTESLGAGGAIGATQTSVPQTCSRGGGAGETQGGEKVVVATPAC